MSKVLTQGQFEALKRIDTPTICNAIEPLNVRRNSEGFMGWNIRCQFPEMGVMLGYAVTATLDTMTPSRQQSLEPMMRLWEAVDASPKPVVLVFKDISPRNSHSCHCGDVMATIASKLGAIGLVTDGGVRDIEGVRALGFQYFAPGMTPAHGQLQVVDVGVPVVVSEVEVLPGDLVHGDENGVVKIPLEIADKVPQAAAEIAAREKQIMNFAQSDDFSLEGLRKMQRPE
jgi:regulator of RNase E activity RraA